MSDTPVPRRRGRPPASAAAPAQPAIPAPEATGGGSPFADASPEARRLAAAILEVLAGTQLPSEAARALGLSLCRYYQLELRAVAGLVAACQRRRGGRGCTTGESVADLRRECDRLRRECARQQALVRAARRTVGLAAATPAPPAAPEPGRKRRRKPTARALKIAALLKPPDAAPPTEDAAPAGPSEPGAPPAAAPPPADGGGT